MMLDDIKDLPVSKWDTVLTTQNQKRVKAAAMRARPYRFDEAASAKIGAFSTECIDLVAANLEFAIPPFDSIYIEIDIQQCISGTGRAHPTNAEPDADWKLGFLIDHGTIWTVACNKTQPHCAVSPWGYIDTSYFEHGVARHDMSPWNEKAELLLGSAVRDVDKGMMSKFLDRFDVGFFGRPNISREAMDYMLAGSVGEIRFLSAALLFLQARRGVSIGGVPFERRMTRGKSRVFMAHSTVTINLEGPVEMRRAFTIGDRQSPRAHEVPAHFAHRYGDRNCEHQWREREDEPTHWDCPLCGRFRYLRKQHMRGDASIGFVTRDYNVIAEKETR
jgi:hypothetical protein